MSAFSKPQLCQFILLVPYGMFVVASDRLQIFWFMLLACHTMSRSFTYWVLAYRTRRTALLRGVTTEISISVSATSRVQTACSTSAYLGRDKLVLLTTSAIPGPIITTGTGPVGVFSRQALPSFHPRFSLLRHLVDWWF